MSKVTAFEAKTRFGELLERVSKGEEVVITRHDKAVARLVPGWTRCAVPWPRCVICRSGFSGGRAGSCPTGKCAPPSRRAGSARFLAPVGAGIGPRTLGLRRCVPRAGRATEAPLEL
ncbi:MAG TPA: type II toxin-antitoxin system prevent-host-death family antitoxin [Vicinamibacteria bacterium]|nr:type II toxin-antitoxin system prevent-host-death family antitoxin [Vicinamibacteria bacterium]